MGKKAKITAAVLGGVTALLSGGSYFVVRKAFSGNFGRWNLEKYSERLRYDDVKENFSRRKVTFYSGKNRLCGYVYGEEKKNGLIVFSHGILAAHEDYLPCILELVKRDFSVFAFDNTGTGESEGKNSRGLVQGPMDLLAALHFIDKDEKLSKRKKVLYGHSQGGYSVCAVLNFYQDVEAVVSVSGFTTPFAVTSEMGRDIYGVPAVITYPFIRLENRRLFGRYSNLSALDGINSTELPIYVMHGVGDDFVRYDGCSIIHHREEITNPNVSYQPMDYPERNAHGDFVLSLEAGRYVREIEKKLNDRIKERGVKSKAELPENDLREFFDKIDKNRASEANKDFFDDVVSFYNRELSAGQDS